MSFELLHRYLNSDQEGGRGWGPINSTALFAIWISILVLFLAWPFIGNGNRRRLCYRRCFKCDWSSDGQDEVLFPMMVTPRYEFKNEILITQIIASFSTDTVYDLIFSLDIL